MHDETDASRRVPYFVELAYDPKPRIQNRPIALILYISQTLDPKPSFQENLTFKETLIFHSSRKMRNALVYRLVSVRILSARANAKLHNKEFWNLAFEAFWRWYLFPICIQRSYFLYFPDTRPQKSLMLPQ